MDVTKKRSAEEYKIFECLFGTFTATCESCGNSHTLTAGDTDEAACAFYEDGWRVRREKLLCKRCH